jgi:hypothetical protein
MDRNAKHEAHPTHGHWHETSRIKRSSVDFAFLFLPSFQKKTQGDET